MKKKADQPKQPPPEPTPERNGVQVLTITSLEQLQAACDQLVHVKALLPGPNGAVMVLVPVRLLRPNESERLELILKEAHPPLEKVEQRDGRTEMQYVPNAQTLEKAASLQRVARAMALWWACPLFKSSDEGKKISTDLKESEERGGAGAGRNAVTDFVQSKFTETILDKLYAVVRADELQLEDRMNFTIPPA